jgi:hypothetical protein
MVNTAIPMGSARMRQDGSVASTEGLALRFLVSEARSRTRG